MQWASIETTTATTTAARIELHNKQLVCLLRQRYRDSMQSLCARCVARRAARRRSANIATATSKKQQLRIYFRHAKLLVLFSTCSLIHTRWWMAFGRRNNFAIGWRCQLIGSSSSSSFSWFVACKRHLTRLLVEAANLHRIDELLQLN